MIFINVKIYYTIMASADSSSNSSETLTCAQCGRSFTTVEDLNEHQISEQQDLEERSKGL